MCIIYVIINGECVNLHHHSTYFHPSCLVSPGMELENKYSTDAFSIGSRGKHIDICK